MSRSNFANDSERLLNFIVANPGIVVLTGAGCSTGSGIPDYRDSNGAWKHAKPVMYQDFVKDFTVRQRYWARSLLGWPRMSRARPNKAHDAIANLERQGTVQCLVTQNVDGLHQKAGSRNVIDLHGRLADVACLGCRKIQRRARWQESLQQLNSDWTEALSALRDAPDGDAIIDGADYSDFTVPDCSACGGIVKPQVVFFGESVPAERVSRVRSAIRNADALLVAGSSLIVYSGYRLARYAASLGKPLAIVNFGFNRAAELADLKLDVDCGDVLHSVTDKLGVSDCA